MKIPSQELMTSSLQSALPFKWCLCETVTARQEANTEQWHYCHWLFFYDSTSTVSNRQNGQEIREDCGRKTAKDRMQQTVCFTQIFKIFLSENPAFEHWLQLSAPASALCTVTFTYPILQKVSLKVCSGCSVFQLLDSKMAVKRQCKWIYCYITYDKKNNQY